MDLRKWWNRFTGGLMDTEPTGNMRTLLTVYPSDTTKTDLRVEEGASGIAVYVGLTGPILVPDQDTLALLIASLTSVMDWLIVTQGDTRTISAPSELGVVQEAPWYFATAEHPTLLSPSK